MLSYSWGMTSNKCGCEAQTPSLVPPIEASPPLIYSHFGDFLGHHRRAVVGQQRTWQTAFLDRLRESVHEILRGLREVPLDVAAQSRVVIEDAQRDGAQPLAVVSEHLERSVVEIEMPQRPDVLGLVAADLSRLAPLSGA